MVVMTSVLSHPNADPHSFESDAKTAAAISRSQLMIENGAGYDEFMDKLLADSPNALGDNADHAEALLSDNDLSQLNERIPEVTRLLESRWPTGGPVRTLTDRTRVMLRLPDSSVVPVQIDAVESTAECEYDDTATADSLLGRPVEGHSPGDTVSWSTPQGLQYVQIVSEGSYESPN
jgi:transcription elongation factor GreA